MLNLIGLVLNIAGTILVSISAGRLMVSIHNSLMGQEITAQASLSGYRDIPVFTGLDESREREMTRSNRILRWGLGLVALGFVLQAVAAYVQLSAGS